MLKRYNSKLDTIWFGTENGAVRVDIYSINGQRIRTLVDEYKTAGNHTTTWNGRDDSGVSVSSGVYVAGIVSGGNVAVCRMVMMR